MSMRAEPVRCWIDFRSSRIWAWIVTSRAVVGSSAMSSLGSHDSAIAIMTRWRMPPDSSWGYCLTRRSGLLMPTRRSDSIARSQASLLADLQVEPDLLGDLVADGEDRVQARQRLLEDHRHVLAADRGASRRSAMTRISRPSNQTSLPSPISAGGMSRRRMTVRAVTLLPEPDSPTMPSVSPRLSWNEIAVDRRHDAVEDAEVGPQVADVEEDVAGRRDAPR